MVLLHSAVVERCQATAAVTIGDSNVPLADTCGVLATWDGTFNLESRGVVLWRELPVCVIRAGRRSVVAMCLLSPAVLLPGRARRLLEVDRGQAQLLCRAAEMVLSPKLVIVVCPVPATATRTGDNYGTHE